MKNHKKVLHPRLGARLFRMFCYDVLAAIRASKLQNGCVYMVIAIVCIITVPQHLFPQSQSAISLYEKGRKAQDAEMYQEAIEAYKSALAQNPRYGNPLVGLAQCYYVLEEYKEALRYVAEAKKYDKNNLSLDTLEGSIRAGLGEFDKARERFVNVLGNEPNNLDARFGLAELDIANGKARQAAKTYLESLDVSPLNKTALLSLVRIYTNLGDWDAAASYLDIATKYYSNDPVVHFTAGTYYDAIGNNKLAAFHYKSALDLKPFYYDAAFSLAILDYKQGNSSDAITLAKLALGSDATDIKYRSRYLLGLFSAMDGNTADSIKSFMAALKLSNDDEVSRIAAETLSVSKLQESDPIRRELALYHFNTGKLYEKNTLLSMAILEYRRALQIDPHYEEARFSYGQILKVQGFPINYFFNLKLLIDYYHTRNSRVLDEYELELKKYNESLSHKWEAKLIDALGSNNDSVQAASTDTVAESGNTTSPKLFNQFTIRKNPFVLSLYTDPSRNTLTHLNSDTIAAAYFKDALSRSDKIAFRDSGTPHLFPNDKTYVTSRTDANRKALEEKTDYYAICSFKELERSFEITATIFLSKTGSEIATFNVYRTGNNRITSALAKCALDIDAALPTRGSILLRELSNGIIDLGSMHGVKKDDTLAIIKKGGLGFDNSKLTLTYKETDVIGEFKVTEADESISSGTITKKGFYDFVNAGDDVVYAPKNDAGSLSQPKKSN